MTRKILIVDDDQKTRTLLKTYLEKNQYEVRLAHDGKAFLSEFERYKDELSLVILDVMLPDTDGFALCRTVRTAIQCADHHVDGKPRLDRSGRRTGTRGG